MTGVGLVLDSKHFAMSGPAMTTHSAINRMKIAKVFKDNTDFINSIDFSASGEHLITSGDDQLLHLYCCSTGRQLNSLPSKKYGADLVRFTHDKDSVIYASKCEWDHAIRYLSLHDFKYLRAFKGHRKPVVSMVMNPSNDGFASASLDGTVRFWDLKSNQCHGVIRSSGRPAVAYDSTGVVFAAGVDDNQIKLFDVRAYDKGPFSTFVVQRAGGAITKWTNLKFSPCNDHLLVGALDGALYLLDAYKGDMIRSFAGHLNEKQSCMEASFSPDSEFVIAGSEEGRIYAWSTRRNNAPHILLGHGAAVTCAKWNPTKMMIASACSTLAFWIPA